MVQSAVEGIPIPKDFDGDLYSRVFRAIEKKYAEPQQPSFQQTAWGLQGHVYRVTACAEHDDAFTNSFAKHGTPHHPERYEQEKHLFEFFVTGLSALECFAYAAYWLGFLVDAAAFPTATPKDLRAISLPNAVKGFEARFPGEALTTSVRLVLDSHEYQEWAAIRNTLAHRSHPGRSIFGSTGSAPERPTEWVNAIPIDANTTRSRRNWLTSEIRKLLSAAETFLAAH